MSKIERWFPLSGVVFAGLMVAIFLISGSQPDGSATSQKVMAYWTDHAGQRVLYISIGAIATVALLAFGSVLRRELEQTVWGALAFAGAIVAATGIAISSAVGAATATAADQGAVNATYVLNTLSNNDFVPWLAGFSALMLAGGIGTLRLRRSRVLAWTGIVFGLGIWTPVGIVAFPLILIWIAAMGVSLSRRGQVTPIAPRLPATANATA